MRPVRAQILLCWAAALAVALVLAAEWVALFRLHAAGPVAQVDRRAVVPKEAVEIAGFVVLGIVALGIAWRAWRRSAPILVRETIEASAALGRRKSVKAAGAAAREIALSAGMRECEDGHQWIAHQFVMWGFIGLFATTSLDALVNPAAQPLALLHPVRLLGNVSGIVFMTGLTLAICRRALFAHVRATSRLKDWTFLLSLWGTGATGFAVQWVADTAQRQATAWVYIAHLLFVTWLLVAAPWTKFVHAAWRPTWVLYRALVTRRT